MMTRTLGNSLLLATVVSLIVCDASFGVAIVDESIVADETRNSDYLLTNANATWTISPGVTVDGVGRYYIEYATPATGSIFTIAGGGTLETSDALLNTRLGFGAGRGTGTLRIIGGSTFQLTNPSGIFGGQNDGGFIVLLDDGSTFAAPGTYDSGTGIFTGTGTVCCTGGGVPVPVIFDGTLEVTDLGSGITQLQNIVIPPVPEPNTMLLIGLGLGFAGLRRRFKRRQ